MFQIVKKSNTVKKTKANQYYNVPYGSVPVCRSHLFCLSSLLFPSKLEHLFHETKKIIEISTVFHFNAVYLMSAKLRLLAQYTTVFLILTCCHLMSKTATSTVNHYANLKKWNTWTLSEPSMVFVRITVAIRRTPLGWVLCTSVRGLYLQRIIVSCLNGFKHFTSQPTAKITRLRNKGVSNHIFASQDYSQQGFCLWKSPFSHTSITYTDCEVS